MRPSKPKFAIRQVAHACFAIAAMLVLSPASPAYAADGRRASMVIDANTGQVLQSSNGDALRHPASLTKMMTLYLLFEEIDSGKLSLSSTIEMTPHAASASPSKLGLDPGEKISVADAIRALTVKSANDIAVAIAEHLGGSESAFARRMTERARQLGMSRTTFRNASGLPDREQVTTARDMLTLALRLQDDFPKLYPFFNTRTFSYRGKVHRTHNSLLGRFPGMDGLKTGYIRMSGFNLVSSVRRGNRHIVAAVFGGRTAASRNAEMRTLLGRTLPQASPVRTRKPTPRLIARARPAPRPERQVAQIPALPVQRPEQQATASADVQAARPTISIARVRAVNVAPQDAPAAPQADTATRPTQPQFLTAASTPAMGLGMAPSTFQQQAENLSRGASSVAPLPWDGASQASAPPSGPTVVAARPALRPTMTAPAADGGFQIQIGAFRTASEAEKALVLALERAGGLLGAAAPLTAPVNSGSRQLYRARFGGFDQQAAANTCTELRRRQIDCFVARAN